MFERFTRGGQQTPGAGPPRWAYFLAAIALMYLVAVVFHPILGFDFIELDVPMVVLNNRAIQGLTAENLKIIFTSRCLTSYYPIRTLSFAIDHQLWGLTPGGFKLTNGLIHTANVLLVFWLVLRIYRHPPRPGRPAKAWWEVCAATFSAGIFAIHPLVVEPVVWVAGREELLMTLGALGCIHFHLFARRGSESGGRKRWTVICHAGAAFCCAAACLSNVVGVVVPPIVTAWDVLTLSRPRWRKIISGTSALWLIGVGAIVLKTTGGSLEPVRSEVGPFPAAIENLGVTFDTRLDLPGALSAERLMLALDVYGMNLKTIFWPNRLAANYTLDRPSGFLDTGVIAGGVLLGLTVALLWSLRRRKSALFGLFWFGLALAPAAQIMPHHVPRADRFLYLPLIGLVLLAAVALRPLGNLLKGRAAVTIAIAVGVSGLLLLDTLSAYQVQTWRSTVTIWEHCVRVYPDNAMAHDALGTLLIERGDKERGLQHYRKAMELDSNDPELQHLLAFHYATCDVVEVRNYDEAIRLATRACDLSDWKKPRYLRGLADIHSIVAAHLANSGRFGQAIENFNKAIEVDPTNDLPLYNLALLLANCSDEELRSPDEAVRLAERARELTKEPNASHLKLLAEIYAAAGRLGDAISAAEQAAELARTGGDLKLAEEMRGQVESYRNRSGEE